MNNLFDTWLALKGGVLSVALDDLNQSLGSSHKHGRFREWVSGKKAPGYKVLRYILNDTLPYALSDSGLTDEQINTVIKRLYLP